MSTFAFSPNHYPGLTSLTVTNRVVLVRVDYNIPALPDGTLADDYRIRVSLPTLRNLVGRGARVVLLTHRGRPQGRVVPELSTQPLAARLEELLGQPVGFVPDCIGRGVEQAIADLPAGQVLMLENTRFHLGEQLNQYDFIRWLARLGTVFINEAFPALHRAHASLSGLAAFTQESGLGLRAQQELAWMERIFSGQPLKVVLGAGQVASQLDLLNQLLGKAETLMIGGVLSHTFLAARDMNIGLSRYEPMYVDAVRHFLAEAGIRGCRILLPRDLMVGSRLDNRLEPRAAGRLAAHESSSGIGMQTAEDWSRVLSQSETLLWLDAVGPDRTNLALAQALSSDRTRLHLVGGGAGIPADSPTAGTFSSGHAVITSLLTGHALPALVNAGQQPVRRVFTDL